MSKTEPFVMLPLSLLDCDAFRSLSINGWRFLRFLMIEQMRHAGKANGALLAPRRQLERAGIGARHVSPAIEECIQAGFVDCRRGVGRHPSSYALTWLPFGDGGAPSDRWRAVATAEGKSLRITSEGKHLVLPKGSHNAVAISEGKSQTPKTRVSEGKHLIRKLLTRAKPRQCHAPG